MCKITLTGGRHIAARCAAAAAPSGQELEEGVFCKRLPKPLVASSNSTIREWLPVASGKLTVTSAQNKEATQHKVECGEPYLIHGPTLKLTSERRRADGGGAAN